MRDNPHILLLVRSSLFNFVNTFLYVFRLSSVSEMLRILTTLTSRTPLFFADIF